MLPRTARGNEYLLLSVDHASRYVCAAALRDKASTTVSKALLREVFENPLLGPPRTLMTDRGKEFEGSVADLCKRFGTFHSRTLSANPSANGVVERANRTALGFLRALDSAGDEWDLHLQGLMQCFNYVPHSSTNYAPLEILTGRPAALPHLIPPWLPTTLEAASSIPRLCGRKDSVRSNSLTSSQRMEAQQQVEEELVSRVQLIRERAVDTQAIQRRSRNVFANAHRNPTEVQVGDQVLRLTYRKAPGVGGKLVRSYQGGYKVEGFQGPTGVVLSCSNGAILDPIPRAQVFPVPQQSFKTPSTTPSGTTNNSTRRTS